MSTDQATKESSINDQNNHANLLLTTDISNCNVKKITLLNSNVRRSISTGQVINFFIIVLLFLRSL